MNRVGSPAAEAVLDVPVVAPAPMARNERARERRLVRAARRGDSAAIDRLIALHWDGAYRTALLISRDHAAAEDIAQEAMISALRSLPRFDHRRAFGSWLHRIVTNRAIDHIRERGRRATLLERSAEVPGGGEDRGGLPPSLSAALARLAVEDRAIVVLRHLFDYRSDEIGRMLGLPAGTVRRRLAEALAVLRAELEEG